MQLTTKQIQIMNVITRGNEDGSFVDVDQLVERVGYETTKQSMQFSIRALVNKSLIMKQQQRQLRRGRSRIVLSATSLGYAVMRGAGASIL